MKFPCRSLLNIPSHLFLTNKSTNSFTKMKFNSFYWMFTFVKQFLLMKERRCICSCNLQLKAEITLNFDSPVFSWQMQMVFKEFFRVIPYRWMSPIYTYLVNQAYESALQSGNFWIRYVSGIAWTLNQDLLFIQKYFPDSDWLKAHA